MEARRAGLDIVAKIDKLFIEQVGPFGQLLIEDAKDLWRQKGWKGPSALRHYVSALALHLDQPSAKDAFVKATNQVVMNATSVRN